MEANRVIEGPKLRKKVPKINLGQFFFDNAHTYSDKIAQIDGVTNEEESFKSVQQRSTRVALELRSRGVTDQDIIVCCLKNDLDNSIPIIAALYLGAKVASLDPRLSVRDCVHLINLVKPKMIFVDHDSVKLIEDSIIDQKIELVVVGGTAGTYPKHSSFQDFVKAKNKEDELKFEVKKVDADETAFIFFSSGTTGFPKGIEISHYGLLAGCYAFYQGFNLNADVVLHFTSLYWISAGMMLVLSYLLGSKRVVCSKSDSLLPLQIIEKHKVTFTFFSSSIANQISFEPEEKIFKYDTSSLHVATVGGSAITVNQLNNIRRILPHTHVVNTYGQTEASCFLTYFDFEKDNYKEKLVSVGRPLVGTKMKIVDPESGLQLGANQKGELLFKSDFYMRGYYQLDSSSVFDEDGFIKTGDIAYHDEDGCIFLVDRLKEMFKYKSWHVVPTALEAVIFEHPDVKEAVVFGVPHELDGDHPAACIVLKNGSKLGERDIIKFVDERVNDIQKLRGGVWIVDGIEKTATGKINRRKVRDTILGL